MGGTSPDFEYWRQFSTLAISQVAALMYGVDPRAMSEVTDEHGDCVDLSDDERVLQSSVLSGALIGYPIQLNAPDRTTKVSVVSLVPWLRARGQRARG